MLSSRICFAAMAMAIIPDEHCRSTDMPATVTGRPAASSAWRATFSPLVPCCIAHPMMTSSTSAGSMPARATAARMACAPSVGASVLLNAPRYALPIGVRAVDTITASFIAAPSVQFDAEFGGGELQELHRLLSAGLQFAWPFRIADPLPLGGDVLGVAPLPGQEHARRFLDQHFRKHTGAGREDLPGRRVLPGQENHRRRDRL